MLAELLVHEKRREDASTSGIEVQVDRGGGLDSGDNKRMRGAEGTTGNSGGDVAIIGSTDFCTDFFLLLAHFSSWPPSPRSSMSSR